MKRLTEKDNQGNWCLKGVPWEQLHEGQVITRPLWEKLYGALWKLMEYEDTELDPEDIEQLNDFEQTQTAKLLKKLNEEQRRHGWTQVEERLPEPGKYILLSFSNFSLPIIGRYEADQEGGTFYLGDCDEGDTCVSQDLFVNAWMPLPEPYRLEGKDKENDT